MKEDFLMDTHIVNEKTGIGYTLHGDYYIPDLSLSETIHEIGKFGRLHLKYLKEHKRLAYTELLTTGRLNAYLHEIDTQAQEVFELLVKEYADKHGVTEQLKAGSQMEWVGMMNNIRTCVEDIVLNEIVYN